MDPYYDFPDKSYLYEHCTESENKDHLLNRKTLEESVFEVQRESEKATFRVINHSNKKKCFRIPKWTLLENQDIYSKLDLLTLGEFTGCVGGMSEKSFSIKVQDWFLPHVAINQTAKFHLTRLQYREY